MKGKTRLKMESALSLRISGLTYAAIGEAIGVSRSRAWQLVYRASLITARAAERAKEIAT